MISLLVFSALLSALGCGLLLRVGQANGRLYGLDMPQRFHSGDVPRLGGLAMALACLAGWAWLFGSSPIVGIGDGFMLGFGWFAAVCLASGAGLLEDITHRLKARWRLGLTLAAGVAAVYLLDLRIHSLGGPAEQPWMLSPNMAMLLAVVAVAGLPHAFNLIDGYNGLASSVAIICCVAIAVVAWQLNDHYIAATVLILAGATAGFLLWNYPRGLIFAGDGGAYLWGVAIAVASIQLVQRHSEVSPWFPMLLLIYPVWETLFSIYRKLVRGQSPGSPDALHFHQLIYRRIVRPVGQRSFDSGDDAVQGMLRRNNRTSPYLWVFTLLSVVPAVLFWRSTPTLMAFCALFIATYVGCYVSIVRFKVPRWLRR